MAEPHSAQDIERVDRLLFGETPPPAEQPSIHTPQDIERVDRLLFGDGDLPPRQFDIDFSRPISEVRAAIGRLPDADRPEALRQWAEAYVNRERSERGTVGGVLNEDLVRSVARGTFLGPFLDEANALTAAGLHRLTGGAAGAPYDEAVAYNRAQDRAVDRDRPIASGAAQVVGALSPLRGIAGGPLIRGRTLPRQVVFGTGLGAVHATSYGAGTADERADALPLGENIAFRAGAGAEMALLGALFGAGAPIVLRTGVALGRPVVDWASPTFARWRASGADLARRVGIHASADGAPPDTAGATAAAEQVIANALLNAGVPRTRIRELLNKAVEDTRFWSNSFAQDALALGDMNPTLQRLASSIGRQSPEAANIMEPFIRARMTGVAAAEEAGALAARGLPTREAMALQKRSDEPAGQMERVRDAFRRSMLIEDEAFHGHLGTGRRTEAAIVGAARREADELYGAAYRAGEGADLTPAIAPVFRNWADTIAQAPSGIARELQRAMRNFFTRDGQMVRDLRRFQEAKEFLDDHIGKLMRSGDRRLAGMLTQMQHDLLAAVDNLPGVGAAYQKARNTFAGRMQMRDALETGRGAFREQSEVGADAYRALTTDGERKLFRLGLLDSYTDAASRMKTGADRLALFDNPRIRDILSEVIPRRGSFDNPRTFGRYLEGEGRMIATRNEVMGNSKTAQRLADDERFKALTAIEEIKTAFASSGFTAAGYKLLERAVKSVFGMRQDTAASIARQLFTADSAERLRILKRIEDRMGSNRMEMLARYLQEYQATLVGAGARGVTGLTSGP